MNTPRFSRHHGDGIAGLVCYLAGPEAAYDTGASLTIDGGFAAGTESESNSPLLTSD